MRHSTVALIATGLGLILAACANEGGASRPESPIIAAREQLLADLGQCGRTYGYDPNATAGIAENQLAPHELQWRQCAYDAADKYEQAVPVLAPRYQQLVNEDITMTNAIQAGAMTRSQRRQRIEALIAQIKVAEENLIQASAEEQQKQVDQVRQVVEQIRYLH
jgi:hypothetical protein